MMDTSTQPFGTYALAPWRDSIRRLAIFAPHSRLGMWIISVVRRLTLVGHSVGLSGPLDINVAENVNARLFPSSNRCEKRALAGIHIWDARERQALNEALSSHKADNPFVFVDVGANVGLYTLFVHASAKQLNKSVKLLAIEPDMENRNRLSFNLEASRCNADIDSSGVAGTAGKGYLSEANKNRGEVHVSSQGSGQEINLNTLENIVIQHELDHIDAMKVDIEGHDLAALKSFFKSASTVLWPKLLIVETQKNSDNEVVVMLKEHDYKLQERAGINAIMTYSRPPADQG